MMRSARQSDLVSWWKMGRNAKLRGHDIAKWASQIKNERVRELFLAGASGEPRPRVRPQHKEAAR